MSSSYVLEEMGLILFSGLIDDQNIRKHVKKVLQVLNYRRVSILPRLGSLFLLLSKLSCFSTRVILDVLIVWSGMKMESK